MAGKIVVLEPELKNRCKQGDFEAIKESFKILLSNQQIKYNQTKADHRYDQGYLHALERLDGLINKA